jgi:hypothetical protein
MFHIVALVCIERNIFEGALINDHLRHFLEIFCLRMLLGWLHQGIGAMF